MEVVMRSRSKRDAHLKRRFDKAKELSGEVLGRQIRDERRMWKKTMSKHSRRIDREEIQDGLDTIGFDKGGADIE